MNIQRRITVALIFLLAGCATITNDWTDVNPPARPAPALAQAKAEAAIRTTMFDPPAGQFQNWSPVYKTLTGPMVNDPVWAICVEANGKNRYGGYAGFRPTQVIFRDGEVGREPKAVEEMDCRLIAKDPARQ